MEPENDAAAVEAVLSDSLVGIDELASHFSVEEVSVGSAKVTAIDDQCIHIEVKGSIDCILQFGSNSDIRRGDGAEIPQSFASSHASYFVRSMTRKNSRWFRGFRSAWIPRRGRTLDMVATNMSNYRKLEANPLNSDESIPGVGGIETRGCRMLRKEPTLPLISISLHPCYRFGRRSDESLDLCIFCRETPALTASLEDGKWLVVIN